MEKSINDISSMMKKVRNVRNMSIISHVQDGGSTVAEFFILKAGIILQNKNEEQGFGNTRNDVRRDIATTEQGCAVNPIYFKTDEKVLDLFIQDPDQREKGESEFFINLLYSPKHEELSTEFTPAMHLADGVFIVVDCFAGLSWQTEIVLRHAINKRIRPVLFLNNLEKALSELQGEELYKKIKSNIETFNSIISLYNRNSVPENQILVDPRKGNVAFGLASQNWAFTLLQFAERYSKTFGLDAVDLMNRLWGDNFYNETRKTWSKQSEVGNQRSFVAYVLNPICEMINALKNCETGKIKELVRKYNVALMDNEKIEELVKQIHISDEDKKKEERSKAVMSRWLPADEALLGMIAIHLPSPVVAQKYTTEVLYKGSKDDKIFTDIQTCNPEGPMIMSITPAKHKKIGDDFYAIGRIYSGKATSNANAFLSDQRRRTVRPVCVLGRIYDQLIEVPSGNICGLANVKEFPVEFCTLSSLKDVGNICSVKFKPSNAVKCFITPTDENDSEKLDKDLRKLKNLDIKITCDIGTGEKLVAATSVIHLNSFLKKLEENKGVPFQKSNPFVDFYD